MISGNLLRTGRQRKGVCEPVDTLMQTLVKSRYSGIPSNIIGAVVKPEIEEVQPTNINLSNRGRALVTAIFPSTDPAVLQYNLKGKAAERTDDNYESIGDISNEEELDLTQIAQIW